MIFIDSNIPMYLIGAEHANKFIAQRLLEKAITEQRCLVSNTEVLQEILHRYTAINRRDAIQPAFDTLLGIVDEIYSIEQVDVENAKKLVLNLKSISARDALHIATMERNNITDIMSFDQGFDKISSIKRMSH